jgi:Mrp family chromosome partitioning ATPase
VTSSEPQGQRPPSALTPDLVVVRTPESEGAQAYRSVRETLRHARRGEPIRSVLLADAGSRDHAGEAAANIGASFALNGDPTVLVDVDSSNPVLHQVLNTPVSPGLIEWLSGRPSADNPGPEPFSTAVDNLAVLPPGAAQDPTGYAPVADLLTDDACQRLLDALRQRARYVIFHASVAPVSSQALTVAASVDAVVLIVRSGMTKRTDAQRAKESLERVGANLLGVVLTE